MSSQPANAGLPFKRIVTVTVMNVVWLMAGGDVLGGNDYLNALVADTSENIYVTGQAANGGADDYATLKYNWNGVQQWKALYNGPGNYHDIARAVTTDCWGNVYVTGSSLGLGSGLDYATIKYSCGGTQQWVARYNGPANGDDVACAIAVDGSGNVYVTGKSLGMGSASDYATVKYNCNGTQQWAARYNGPANGNDMAIAISLDWSENTYVTGSSLGLGSGLDYATIKYNCAGIQEWASRYNGPARGDDTASAMTLDHYGNVYVTGKSLGLGSGLDYATLKYNCSGTQQWAARYNGPANGGDTACAIALDGSWNVYVTGASLGSGSGLDYATIRYSSAGSQKWVRRYNGTANGNDMASAIAVDGSANVHVTGKSLGLGSLSDYATVKYNCSGVAQWVARYNGLANGDDSAVAIAVNCVSGNVYVGGSSLGSGTGSDYATVKYNCSGFQQWVSRYDGP